MFGSNLDFIKNSFLFCEHFKLTFLLKAKTEKILKIDKFIVDFMSKENKKNL